MANNKRKCLLCGQEYKFCNNCNGQKLPTWHNLFHDENCYMIWNVLCDYENGNVTKEEAQEKLNAIDASIIKEKTAISTYTKIFGIAPVVEETPVEESAPTEEPKAEEPTPVEDSAPVAEETPVVEEATAPAEDSAPVADEPKAEEPLSVSEELKKHNNNRHKFNKKN